MIVDKGAEQVVGRGDGVDVAGEVEVDVFHRDDLTVAAARRAAFDAEYRAQGGFPQGQHSLFAEPVHSLRQADRHGGLAFAGRSRVDGRDKDELAVLFVRQSGEEVLVQFGFVFAVKLNFVLPYPPFGGQVGYFFHLTALGDLNVRQHSLTPFVYLCEL